MNRKIAALLLALAAFFDPPWVAGTTEGLRAPETDDRGVTFRWTTGHATFYVPTSARQLILRLSSGPLINGRPAIVRLSIDDGPVANVTMTDPAAWQVVTVFVPQRRTLRRSRRVDLHVNRTVGESNLGVRVSAVEWH